MMEMFKLNNLSYEINDVTLFQDIQASVKQGEIIGVIGKNGAGKTTLLQLLNGDLAPSSGQIQWLKNGVKVAMVEQELEDYNLAIIDSYLLKKWRVPTVDYRTLSGGEKLKARLAEGFASEADLLLLDEPTNHIDESGMKFLVDQMRNFKGTVIFVSHDRYFLDLVATKIWSIEDAMLIEHYGNYSSYMKARREKRLSQERAYEKQQKMVERMETQMKQLTNWSDRAHKQSTKQEGKKEYYRVKAKRMDAQVKSKQKRLEKELAKVDLKPVASEYEVRFSLKAMSKKGKRFVEVKSLSKSFGERELFGDVHFSLKHGERIALVGPNGSGKSTLLKILLGVESAEGEVWMSPSAEIGYLTQDVFDLPLDATPEQLFFQETFQERGKVQTLMRHLGFTAAQWVEPIGMMSMGERVKCKLMEYILKEKDVLILDEPTNHLDLPSREQLEQTLQQYEGTLLVVSHDRYFLEKITTSQLVIAEEKIYLNLANSDGKVPQDDKNDLLLRLETERQEVLGRLSFMDAKHKDYGELDQRFHALTKQIQGLRSCPFDL